MALLLFAAAAIAAWFILARRSELFCLAWRNGEMRLVRGAVPTGVRVAIREALESMKVEQCTVRGLRAEPSARLVAKGVDDFQAQRLRNIFMLYPLAKLRDAEAPTRNRLLRWIGIASLIWAIGRRDE